jgi:hypothetical protein
LFQTLVESMTRHIEAVLACGGQQPIKTPVESMTRHIEAVLSCGGQQPIKTPVESMTRHMEAVLSCGGQQHYITLHLSHLADALIQSLLRHL